MSTFGNQHSSFDASNEHVNETLKYYVEYVTKVAWRRVPRNVVPQGALDMVVHDIVQDVCEKFWKVAQRQEIVNPKAYLQRMVGNEVINMVRHYKPLQPLLLDNDNEICSGNVLLNASQGMRDPLYELEQEETEKEYIAQTIDAAQDLPPCQRRALICALKDQLDDRILLTDALSNSDMDIDTFDWPEEKRDMQTLRTSLSVARKKLRTRLGKILGQW